MWYFVYLMIEVRRENVLDWKGNKKSFIITLIQI